MRTTKNALAVLAMSFLATSVNAAQSIGSGPTGSLRLPYREAGLDAEQAATVLLDRFAYGARPDDVKRVVAIGPARWLEEQLEAAAGGSAGDVFAQLQYPLHSGRIGGVLGRTVICIIGILVVVLSVTGLVIWWRKQRAHAYSRARVPRAVERIPCAGYPP